MSEKNNAVRRTTIQAAVAPAVEAALKGIEALDLSRPEDARRLMRALVRIGCSKALEAHGPGLLAQACIEAIAREVEGRTETFVAEAAPMQTQPAEPFPC